MNQSALKPTRSIMSEERYTISGTDADDVVDLQAIASTLWRGKLWMVLAVILACFAGGYYAFGVAIPKYRSTAVVMLETRQEQVVSLDSVVGSLGTDVSAVNSEMEVLKSRALLGKVVDALDLTQDPEFNRSLSAPSSSERLSTYIRALFTEPQLSAESTQATADKSAERQNDATVSSLLRAVTITNIPRSVVFQITVETTDPKKSALIADTMARLYVRDQVEAKFEATEQATSWLAERVTSLQKDLELSEGKVKDFRSSIDLISVDTLTALERQLKDSRDRLESTRTNLSDTQEKLRTMRRAQTPESKILASGGDVQLQRMMDTGTAEAMDAFNLRFQQIMARSSTDIQRLENEISALNSLVNQQERQLEQQSSDLITLQQLTREAEASRLLYEYFLSRLKETSVQQGVQRPDSRIISSAVIPGAAFSPRRELIVAVSALLGLIASSAGLLLNESRKYTYRTTIDLERGTRHSVFGQIPMLPAKMRRETIRYLARNPTSHVAEAIRDMRTSLLLSSVDSPPKVIMVSSAFPGEGKTTISLALAQNLAGMGKSVLIIEGDIRRQIFGQYFEVSDSSGMTSVLTGESSIDEAVRYVETIGADVIISGTSAVNAADLFSSSAFENFINEVSARYDAVIIDTPPVMVVPDARVISQYTDARILVVKWDETQRSAVAEALKMFESVGQPVSGLVLNQISAKGMKRYGYGYYGSYGAARKYYNG